MQINFSVHIDTHVDCRVVVLTQVVSVALFNEEKAKNRQLRLETFSWRNNIGGSSFLTATSFLTYPDLHIMRHYYATFPERDGWTVFVTRLLLSPYDSCFHFCPTFLSGMIPIVSESTALETQNRRNHWMATSMILLLNRSEPRCLTPFVARRLPQCD